MVELLVNNGAEIDKAINGGSTPLMQASYYGRLEVVNLLIQHKADVHFESNCGETGLDWARETGNKSVRDALQKGK